MFEAIEDAIKMMTVGSTAELTLSFEDDDLTVNPELRGKALRYELTLKSIQQRELPELDDELAKKIGQFDSYGELLTQVRKDLLREKAQAARNEATTEIVNAMADSASIEIPGALVDREIDDQITQLTTRLAQQGLTLVDYLAANSQTEESYREQLRGEAERRVRNSIVLQAIAKAENIEVTPEDVEAEIDRLVAPAENSERLRALYDSDYFKNLLQNELFDRKLTDRLIEIATEGRGAVVGAGAAALIEEPAAVPLEQTSQEQAGETDLSDDAENVVEFAPDLAPPAGEAAAEAAQASSEPAPEAVDADLAADEVELAADDAREDWSAAENAVDFGADLEPDDAQTPIDEAKQATADAHNEP